MAGFLNALSFMAPVGQTLGPAMQIGARQAELDQQKQAFGKLLDTLGPEYEPFRQYFKAGGTPHEVSAAMGGTIGQEISQKWATQRAAQIWEGPGTPIEKMQRMASEGLGVSWSDVTKAMTAKEPPISTDEMVDSIRQMYPQMPPEWQAQAAGALQPGASRGYIKQVYDSSKAEMGTGLYTGRIMFKTITDQYGTQHDVGFRVNPRTGQADIISGPPNLQEIIAGGGKWGPETYTPSMGGGGVGGGITGAQPPSAAAAAGFPPAAPSVPAAGTTPPGAPPGAAAPPPAAGGAGAGIPPAAAAPTSAAAARTPMVFAHLGMREQGNVITINALLPQLANVQQEVLKVADRWDRTFFQRGWDQLLAQKLNYLPGSDPVTGLNPDGSLKNPATANAAAQVTHVQGQLQSLPQYQQLQMEDPEMARAMSDLITVEAQAQAALMASANTGNYQFVKDSHGHIPTSLGNVNSILTNIDTLSGPNGPYRSLLRSAGIEPRGPLPIPLDQLMRPKAGAGGGGAPGAAPAAPSNAATPVTWDPTPTTNYPQGKWKYQDKNGNWQFRGP